jgi:membrane protein required for colicin V production
MITAVFAIFFAIWFYGSVGSLMSEYVSHRMVANFIGFVIVLVIVSAIGGVIGWGLSRAFRWVGLGWLDRLMGGGVGLVRGALFSTGLILLLCAFTRTPPPQAVVMSRFSPYVIEISHVFSFIAPRELRDSFEQSYDKIKKAWVGAKAAPGTL